MSSLRLDYNRNSLSPDPEYAVAKGVAPFMNTRKGSVIIGVDNTGSVIGLD
jgi:predicted HTH transcriptional regulator